jgi:hypothetical protein
VFLGWHPTSPSFPVCHRFCALFELQFLLFFYLPPLFPYLPPENGGQLGKAVKTSSRAAMKDAQIASSSAVLDDGSSLQKAAIVAANRDAGEAPAAGF